MPVDRPILVDSQGRILLDAGGRLADPACCCGPPPACCGEPDSVTVSATFSLSVACGLSISGSCAAHTYYLGVDYGSISGFSAFSEAGSGTAFCPDGPPDCCDDPPSEDCLAEFPDDGGINPECEFYLPDFSFTAVATMNCGEGQLLVGPGGFLPGCSCTSTCEAHLPGGGEGFADVPIDCADVIGTHVFNYITIGPLSGTLQIVVTFA